MANQEIRHASPNANKHLSDTSITITDLPLVKCPVCNRNFHQDRTEKHTLICQKVYHKKRPVFDSRQQRLRGTDAEFYLTKSMRRLKEPEIKSNWRQKHEEFVRLMREGRRVYYYINKGYDLSKLPPPVPSENPNYIECPYCYRRFAPGPAERHIAKCKYIISNKPTVSGSGMKSRNDQRKLTKEKTVKGQFKATKAEISTKNPTTNSGNSQSLTIPKGGENALKNSRNIPSSAKQNSEYRKKAPPNFQNWK